MTDLRQRPTNNYQRRKAKLIAAVLLRAAALADIPMAELHKMAARMTPDQWRTVSFQAGVPVADHEARVLTVALLMRLA